MTEPGTDAFVHEDEAVLRERRRRLRTVAAALTEVRQANTRAAGLITELMEAGDLTRADVGQVFGLSKGERAALIP